jgi:cytochrome c553
VSVGLPILLVCAGTAAAQAPLLDDVLATKAITCTICHGPDGNSRWDAVPSIAGMNAAYFKKQMQDYAAGRRPSPEMEPWAKQVLDIGLDDITVYFARQKFRPSPVPVAADAVERGRQAVDRCVTCHGRDGKGDPTRNIPSLAGQPPGYLREQVMLFKQDKRNPGDAALKEMKAVLQNIPDATLADLAAYYSSLR